jgi:hypothetical protein
VKIWPLFNPPLALADSRNPESGRTDQLRGKIPRDGDLEYPRQPVGCLATTRSIGSRPNRSISPANLPLGGPADAGVYRSRGLSMGEGTFVPSPRRGSCVAVVSRSDVLYRRPSSPPPGRVGARRRWYHLHQLAGVRSSVRWAWAQSVKLRAGRLVTVVMSPVGWELYGSRVERNCSMMACASSSGMP